MLNLLLVFSSLTFPPSLVAMVTIITSSTKLSQFFGGNIMAEELGKLIDFKMLESDTRKACQDEKLYWIRNDAKMRAATGKPIEYEEFRQIVDAAHLKPLEKKDAIKPNDLRTVWNPLCQRNESYIK